MNSNAIEIWLRHKQSSGATSRSLLAIVAVLAGLGVLFLTFWFTYAIIWAGFQGVTALADLTVGKRLHLTHEWRLAGSGIFIALLFLQHFCTSPWHWGDYPRENFDRAFGLNASLGAIPALLSCPGTSANMIADILLSGPRLLTGAGTLIRESSRLRRMDVAGCSQLLAFLARRPMVVPYQELREAGWEAWFGQLRNIEGVVFLEQGLNLTAELRKDLVGLRLD
ncbi:MAG: hypothetical protein V9H26_06740 [Verrucomicrobiota bacterium]